MTAKQITICADDFGQNQSIDDGILKLVKLERLQAVTVFTESSGWDQRASELKLFEKQIDIGIHLNLTESFSGFSEKYSLNELLILSHLKLIKQQIVKNSFRKQIELYVAKMNALPTFLDGHQHVHALPVINQALQEIILEFWGKNPTLYVRDSSRVNLDLDNFFIKKIILKLAGAGLAKKMAEIGVQMPLAFTGIYNFSPRKNYSQLVHDWLKSTPTHSLMMCHPACAPKSSPDSLFEARLNEFNYLSSDDFLALCQSLKVKLTRYSDSIQISKAAT